MDDRIRVSDADRENVASRLREHYAEGRLSSDELEERVASALGARTFGDLRRVMTDLPGPVPAPPPGQPAPPPGARRRHYGYYRRGPRLLPLVLIALIAALVLPGVGWLFFAFLKVFLLFWLVALVVGLLAAARFRRRARRYWQSGGDYWRHYQWRG
jgi:Domain of unknown function (DUF1707)